jgi:hypothetical protein
MNIDEFVKISLEYYDNQNNIYEKEKLKFDKYIQKRFSELRDIEKKYKTLEKVKITPDKPSIFDSDKYKVQYLAMFDIDASIFTWGWAISNTRKNEKNAINKLVSYGLNLETNQIYPLYEYLKLLLTSSRIKLDTEVELDLLLALVAYVLKDKVDFIYSGISESPNPYINYYIVKISN